MELFKPSEERTKPKLCDEVINSEVSGLLERKAF